MLLGGEVAMLGLPKSTECKKALHKKDIFAQFDFSRTKRKDFDANFARLHIIHEVTPYTVNIPQGKSINGLYVIHITLKHAQYDKKSLQVLAKLLPYKVIFLLEYAGKGCIVLYHTVLFESAWQAVDTLHIHIQGLDFDAVWENIVQQVGEFTLEEKQSGALSLEAQIAHNVEQDKIAREIARLEKKVWAEKQPRKKMELVERLRKIKERLR